MVAKSSNNSLTSFYVSVIKCSLVTLSDRTSVYYYTYFLNNLMHITGAKLDPGPCASIPLFARWIFSIQGPTLGGGFSFLFADFFFFFAFFLPRDFAVEF